MGDPATSVPAACAITSLVATNLGQAPAELAPQDLGDARAQGTLLALDRVAGVRANSTEQLLSMLAKADQRERLLDISAAFLDEQSVWAFNQTDPDVTLQAIYPTDGVATEEISFTPSGDSERTALVEEVSAALTAREPSRHSSARASAARMTWGRRYWTRPRACRNRRQARPWRLRQPRLWAGLPRGGVASPTRAGFRL